MALVRTLVPTVSNKHISAFRSKKILIATSLSCMAFSLIFKKSTNIFILKFIPFSWSCANAAFNVSLWKLGCSFSGKFSLQVNLNKHASRIGTWRISSSLTRLASIFSIAYSQYSYMFRAIFFGVLFEWLNCYHILGHSDVYLNLVYAKHRLPTVQIVQSLCPIFLSWWTTKLHPVISLMLFFDLFK